MTQQPTKLRPVALPAEHGGWSLIIEPILLGLLLAPSVPGLFIALAAFACFLARHPLKLAIGDRRKNRILTRTSLADRFTLLYVALACIFFIISVTTAARGFLFPLLIAAPLVFLQFLYDALGQSRKLMPEIAGALAVGAISTAIALVDGWSKPTAFALWVIVACRHMPTIVYLRVLLSGRRQEQRAMVKAVVIGVQLLAVVAAVILLFLKIAPAITIVVFAVLFVRAVAGLLNRAAPVPKKLGISEIVFGAFAVLTVFAGYRLGW